MRSASGCASELRSRSAGSKRSGGRPAQNPAQRGGPCLLGAHLPNGRLQPRQAAEGDRSNDMIMPALYPYPKTGAEPARDPEPAATILLIARRPPRPTPAKREHIRVFPQLLWAPSMARGSSKLLSSPTVMSLSPSIFLGRDESDGPREAPLITALSGTPAVGDSRNIFGGRGLTRSADVVVVSVSHLASSVTVWRIAFYEHVYPRRNRRFARGLLGTVVVMVGGER